MEKKIMPPIHPGKILMKEFLEPMGITQYCLSKDVSVVPRRINEIVHGKRAITAFVTVFVGRKVWGRSRAKTRANPAFGRTHRQLIQGVRQ